MVRAPILAKNGLKKGSWSQEEDDKLRNYVMRYGHWNWRELPKFAGLSRCGKSCRLRWLNYLKPGVKRGGYSKEEEDLIIELHQRLGNRWSSIAAKLPGRTDNEVKNHWNSNIKKRLREQSNSRSTVHQVATVRIDESINIEQEAGSGVANISCPAPVLETSSASQEVESGDFWTQPFVSEDWFNDDHHLQGQDYSLICQDYWELDFLSDIYNMLV